MRPSFGVLKGLVIRLASVGILTFTLAVAAPPAAAQVIGFGGPPPVSCWPGLGTVIGGLAIPGDGSIPIPLTVGALYCRIPIYPYPVVMVNWWPL